MAKNSKINQIINKTVSNEWFFLTKRSDIPPLPAWYKIKYSALSQENKKIYGVGIPWACFWYDNNTEFYLHGKEYRLAIQRATKILYSKHNFNKHLVKIKQTCRDAQKSALALKNKHWKNFDDRQIQEIYAHSIKKYVLSYVYGFITWCTPVLQNDAKIIINNYSVALKKIGISPDQALGMLIIPDDTTAYQQKEKAIVKLSKKYKNVLDKYESEKFLLDNHPQLHSEIKKFLDKYCWVGFNYSGPVLDYKAVVKELLQSQDSIKSEKLPTKEEICKFCKFKAKEKHIFYALGMISYTKDLRNVTDDYVHHCFVNFYDEVSKRVGLRKQDIQFLWDDELNELLAGGKKITRKYIQEKEKFCAAFASPESVGVRQYYIGDEARNQREHISKNSNQSLILKGSPSDIIKGTVASTGTAIGIVKIIHNLREADKVKKGDILVAGMTSPKYMPAILNSGAIITDDGGLTCHAAIIARELKKPCIIGTKIATDILSDGDLVEVNANSGVIKIIKKKTSDTKKTHLANSE
ncbi:MAG: PEP-utilizing enzyme [Patescibacteria group bacterium]|jgi:phosphoenolpyruvate synthase/pyruvate phosphate dikinase